MKQYLTNNVIFKTPDAIHLFLKKHTAHYGDIAVCKKLRMILNDTKEGVLTVIVL